MSEEVNWEFMSKLPFHSKPNKNDMRLFWWKPNTAALHNILENCFFSSLNLSFILVLINKIRSPWNCKNSFIRIFCLFLKHFRWYFTYMLCYWKQGYMAMFIWIVVGVIPGYIILAKGLKIPQSPVFRKWGERLNIPESPIPGSNVL